MIRVVVLAFLLRAGAGLLLAVGVPALDVAPRAWWTSGYSHYAEIARNLLATGEYRIGDLVAPRPPLYPAFLAGTRALFGESAVAPVVLHSAIGAATVYLTAVVARRVFDARAGLFAGAIAAIYPYWVVHDTSLQETALFTLLVAAAVERLLAARASGSLGAAAASGLLFGLAVLCRESALLVVPIAALWLAAYGLPAVPLSRRLRGAALLIGAAALVVAPWATRNALRLGTPVLEAGTGSGAGYRLWVGNNPWTLTAYPRESIDVSTGRAWSSLSATDRAALDALDPNLTDGWFFAKASAFIRQDPIRFLRAGFVKLNAGLGPLVSPRGSLLRDLLYSLSWVPLALLALAGLWRFRRAPFAVLAVGLLATFVLSTFVFHAHTSHRVWLDLHVIVLAAAGLTSAATRRAKPTQEPS